MMFLCWCQTVLEWRWKLIPQVLWLNPPAQQSSPVTPYLHLLQRLEILNLRNRYNGASHILFRRQKFNSNVLCNSAYNLDPCWTCRDDFLTLFLTASLPVWQQGSHWFDLNDSAVTSIRESDIEKQFQGKESAYMLFYRKTQLHRPHEGEGLHGSYEYWESLRRQCDKWKTKVVKIESDFLFLTLSFSNEANQLPCQLKQLSTLQLCTIPNIKFRFIWSKWLMKRTSSSRKCGTDMLKC